MKKLFLVLILLGIIVCFGRGDLYAQQVQFTTLTKRQVQQIWDNRSRASMSQENGIIGIFFGVKLIVYPGTNLRGLLYNLDLCIGKIWFPSIEDDTKYFVTIQLNKSKSEETCLNWTMPGKILITRHALVKENQLSETCAACNGMILRKMRRHLNTAAISYEPGQQKQQQK